MPSKKTSRRKQSHKSATVAAVKVLGVGLVVMMVLVFVFRRPLIRFVSNAGWLQRGATVVWSKLPGDKRNIQLLKTHSALPVGIDISHYQRDIVWKDVTTVYDSFPISFVVVRATMGVNGKDKKFQENWEAIKHNKKVRGAYHYYRPDEYSGDQAQNYIKSVSLGIGDLPPILDIEDLSNVQTIDRLKTGLQNWLNIVEAHYGVRPIIYSGNHYFDNYLANHFSSYPVWVANYNHHINKPQKEWRFWQFTEKGFVRGINGAVDVNLFNGTMEQLYDLRIK